MTATQGEKKLNSKGRMLLHLAEVKEQLAAKYARLAKTVSSRVRRQIYLNRVKKLTLQAKNARILAEQQG
ncbi:MAG: hypothetical protein WBH86_08130 [Thermogutta sp.]